jgi:hypothetical protein
MSNIGAPIPYSAAELSIRASRPNHVGCQPKPRDSLASEYLVIGAQIEPCFVSMSSEEGAIRLHRAVFTARELVRVVDKKDAHVAIESCGGVRR